MPKLNAPPTTPVSIRVRHDVIENIRKIAHENYRSVSSQINLMLDKYLEEMEPGDNDSSSH